MAWDDVINYDHATQKRVVENFKRLREALEYYEKKSWIFDYITYGKLQKLHEAISGVIAQVKKGEGFYGYYVYLRDMSAALDDLSVQTKHGDQKKIAKAYANVLMNASKLISVVPVARVYADPLASIAGIFEAFVNKVMPWRGDEEYRKIYQQKGGWK